MSKSYCLAKNKIYINTYMSLDFILIPISIFAILWLLNRENKIYRENKKVN